MFRIGRNFRVNSVGGRGDEVVGANGTGVPRLAKARYVSPGGRPARHVRYDNFRRGSHMHYGVAGLA